MAQGDIDAVAGIADVISSPVGTVTTRPLIPVSWQQGPSTLGLGTIAPPRPQGGLEGDAGGGNHGDPDTYLGSFTLQTGPSTLGLGTVAHGAGKGDVPDIFGTPDISVMPAQKVAGLIAWTAGVSSLSPGAITTPKGQGDVGSVGMSPTPKNEWNDSAQGAGTLIAWNSGASSLVPGSIPQVRDQGDIDAIYSPNEHWAGVNPTWQTGVSSIATGAVAPILNGDGDIPNDGQPPGIVGIPSSSSWALGYIAPVLSAVINGLLANIRLTWTGVGAPALYNVYRSVNSGAFSLYQTNLSALTYTDSGVNATSTYAYSVSSELPVLNSNVANPYPLTPPVLTGVVSGGMINLSWTSIGITTTYNLYRSVDGGAFSLYQSGLTGLAYSDTALTRGNHTYSYYVVSFFPQYTSNTVGPFVGQYIDLFNVVGTATWTKRAGAFLFDIPTAIAGGGGGGAGALQNVGTAGGGAAGGGGQRAFGTGFNPALVTATVTVTIGTGGLGAANTSSNGGNGGITSFGSYLNVNGGFGGISNAESGALTAGGSGGTTTLPGVTFVTGGAGGAGDNASDTGINAPNTTNSPSGGGGNDRIFHGGGTGGNVGALATGGTPGSNAIVFNPPNPGSLTAGNGTNGATSTDGNYIGSGAGGGGTAYYGQSGCPVGVAGNGGNGALGGGGGGGGGYCGGCITVSGGAGGNGGQGVLEVITYMW